jgi:hypothetical protein
MKTKRIPLFFDERVNIIIIYEVPFFSLLGNTGLKGCERRDAAKEVRQQRNGG